MGVKSHYIYLVIPDLHYPFHCPQYISIVTKALRLLSKDDRFRGLIQLGDFVDWWQISSYDKDPSRKETALDDLQGYIKQMNEWSRIMPEGSIFHQLEGNHEFRLKRYVWRNAAQIADMVRPLDEMLGFPERNKVSKILYKWHEYSRWDSCKIGDTAFHHGFYFSQHVAAKCLQVYPCSIVFGHTHRIQHVEFNNKFATSLGHGSDAKKTAHTPTPNNWCKAFGVFHSVGSKGSIEVVSVRQNKAKLWGELLVP